MKQCDKNDVICIKKTYDQEKEKVLKQHYKEGIICFIDVLGFSKLTYEEKNISLIKQFFKELLELIQYMKVFGLDGEISILSDSIVFTSDVEDTKDYHIIDAAVDFLSMVRDIVINLFNTDIIASISYGKYIHLEDVDILFGPGISRAVKIAESKIKYPYYDKDNPAKIIIDNTVLSSKHNIDHGISNHLNNNPWYQYIGDGYYLVNSYFPIYKLRKPNHEKETPEGQYKFWKKVINKNKEVEHKYKIVKTQLDEFNDYYKNMAVHY